MATYPKLRTGTFSCQECRRRKKRCVFDEAAGNGAYSCISCRKNGTPCLSQTLDADDHTLLDARLKNMEAQVEMLVRRRRKKQCLVLANCYPLPMLPLEIHDSWTSRSHSLNEFLLPVLPAPDLALQIVTLGRSPLSAVENSPNRMQSYRRDGFQDERNVRPMALARDLLQLAVCLDRLDLNADGSPELLAPATTARRYFDAARQVTFRDGMVDCVEGIEALMLECSYQMNKGNLESAWIAIRRALSAARLAGTRYDTALYRKQMATLWKWLVHFDLILSLNTGQTHAMVAEPMVVYNTDPSPLGQLESTHVTASERIIKRNLRMQRLSSHTGEGHDHLAETRSTDDSLKQAAHNLPTEWWALPIEQDLTSYGSRLIPQVQHYDLIVQLHLPYLITGLASPSTQRSEHEYSKLAAAAAGRELLSRHTFICDKGLIRGSSGGGAVPKSFSAAVALLLAQIDGHRLGALNVLEHQRASDLNMVKDAVASIRQIRVAGV
ncbi:hypothetical protein BDY17DRAFT_310278 [Neohortaea acidophila]|uniref:Zn(2)-C6 fungal-type domain-containing protein n=1 Tax=Neohortaea acidophila TaxID=245834 RepID=A0A6A6PVD8_9PEZI|nr:uncharacterized protein BDY17DRAFT_310278 [Neohortaea acidophila]KAF2483227.1 hypothetical protein BDY17DRAFT_310278 [Neohortaea acidophila]